ncbi:MAG: hypothetical protein WC704_02340 [Sphingomonas sp.]|jgi:hypothetical protein
MKLARPSLPPDDTVFRIVAEEPWLAAGSMDTGIRWFTYCRSSMQSRKFPHAFKLEAVRLVRERGGRGARLPLVRLVK